MRKFWRIVPIHIVAVCFLTVSLWADDHALHEVPQYGVKIAIQPGPTAGNIPLSDREAFAVGWRQASTSTFQNAAISIQTSGGKYRAYLTEGLGKGAKLLAKAQGPTEPGQPLFPRQPLQGNKAYYIVIVGASDQTVWNTTANSFDGGVGVSSLGALSARAGSGDPYAWDFKTDNRKPRFYVTAQWSHNPKTEGARLENWSKLGPPAQMCGNTTGQSPIDIRRERSRHDNRELKFHYDGGFRSEVENLGYTIEASAAKSPGPFIEYQGTPYYLAQFHVHAPSEHELDGKPYDFEVHLVHKSRAGALAVVGVLYHRSADARETGLDTVMRIAPETVGGTDERTIPLDFIPKDGDFYYYTGSLTTPACGVPVQFIIAAAPEALSGATVDRLHDLISKFPLYGGFPDNSRRPPQPDNGRDIYRRMK